jgi:transposase InsO family protein
VRQSERRTFALGRADRAEEIGASVALVGRLARPRPASQSGVTLDFSRPGKPTDNAFVEPFKGRLRDECLNAHWFLSRLT